MFENALQPTKVRSRMQISIIRYEVHFVGHARCIFNPANDCELMHTHTIRRKMHFFVCVRVVEWKKKKSEQAEAGNNIEINIQRDDRKL